MANKAVFFDRDGTLNVDTGYLHRPEDFVWIEGAKEAVRYVNQLGYLAIVVTNQSGVARGYYPEEDIRRLHDWMNENLSRLGDYQSLRQRLQCCSYNRQGFGDNPRR